METSLGEMVVVAAAADLGICSLLVLDLVDEAALVVAAAVVAAAAAVVAEVEEEVDRAAQKD